MILSADEIIMRFWREGKKCDRLDSNFDVDAVRVSCRNGNFNAIDAESAAGSVEERDYMQFTWE